MKYIGKMAETESLLSTCCTHVEEKSNDTKGVVRSHKLKERHYNGQNHEQWFTKYLQASVIAQYISSKSHENVHIPSFNE